MIYELLEKVAPNSTTTITSSDSLSSDSLSSDSLSSDSLSMDDIFAELANCCDYDDVESNNSETYSDKIKNSIKDLQNKLSDNGIIQVCYIKEPKIGKPKNISLLINKNENDITVDHIKEEIGEVSAFAEILRYHPTWKNRDHPTLENRAHRAVYIADSLRYCLAKSNKDNNIFVKSSIDDYADFHKDNVKFQLKIREHYHTFNVHAYIDDNNGNISYLDIYEEVKPLNDYITKNGNSIVQKRDGVTLEILGYINTDVFASIFNVRKELFLQYPSETQLGMSLEDFINNVSICLVKSKKDYADSGIDKVIVKNIFTGEMELREIPDDKGVSEDKEMEDDYYNGKTIMDYLGCYCPDKGCIFIWIDKIFDKCEKENYDFENLFDIVLLHEYIHALLDVRPRKANYKQNITTKCLYEESIDNALLLHAMNNSKYGSDAKRFVAQGQKKLPSYYKGWELFVNYSLAQLEAIIKEWLPNK